jgi:hypothetical protein
MYSRGVGWTMRGHAAYRARRCTALPSCCIVHACIVSVRPSSPKNLNSMKRDASSRLGDSIVLQTGCEWLACIASVGMEAVAYLLRLYLISTYLPVTLPRRHQRTGEIRQQRHLYFSDWRPDVRSQVSASALACSCRGSVSQGGNLCAEVLACVMRMARLTPSVSTES